MNVYADLIYQDVKPAHCGRLRRVDGDIWAGFLAFGQAEYQRAMEQAGQAFSMFEDWPAHLSLLPARTCGQPCRHLIYEWENPHGFYYVVQAFYRHGGAGVLRLHPAAFGDGGSLSPELVDSAFEEMRGRADWFRFVNAEGILFSVDPTWSNAARRAKQPRYLNEIEEMLDKIWDTPVR